MTGYTQEYKAIFMKSASLKKIIMAASIMVAAGYAGGALAHSAGATIDSDGNNASATDLAQVICYDDGDGPADHLYVTIQDNSPPVSGLLLSAQIFKDGQMTNVTDTVSGDANSSPPARISGGDGVYYLSVSKTATGARNFTVTYHCQTAADVHTGTDITVLQGQ